jgi:hypothetical protein
MDEKLEGVEVQVARGSAPVQIGRVRVFIVPEASLEVAEQVLPLLEQMKAARNDAEAFGSITEVVRLCLVENYPDITGKEIKKALPFKRSIEIMREVLRAAGFERDDAAPSNPAPEGAAGEPVRP